MLPPLGCSFIVTNRFRVVNNLKHRSVITPARRRSNLAASLFPLDVERSSGEHKKHRTRSYPRRADTLLPPHISQRTSRKRQEHRSQCGVGEVAHVPAYSKLRFFNLLFLRCLPSLRSSIRQQQHNNNGSASFCEASPSNEVASLIQQFDEKLTRFADDNAQLRVFCTHLEGLLAAAAAAAKPAAGADGNGTNGRLGGGRGEAGGARFPRQTAGGDCNGAAEGSGSPRPSPQVAARRRESLGERRRGSALAGPFQELC